MNSKSESDWTARPSLNSTSETMSSCLSPVYSYARLIISGSV